MDYYTSRATSQNFMKELAHFDLLFLRLWLWMCNNPKNKKKTENFTYTGYSLIQ